MSKATLILTVLVGGFAVGIYLWQNELTSLLSGDDNVAVSQRTQAHEAKDSSRIQTDTEKGKVDDKKVKETDSKTTREENREELVSQNKETDNGQEYRRVTEVKDQESHAKQEQVENDKTNQEETDVPPEGHLKQLGKHGAQVNEAGIEELDYVPNGKDFYTHFIRKRVPLIMRGAAKSWPAVKHWANESYLLENYAEVIFDVEFTKKYERKPPVKRTMNLKEYLNIYRKESVYLDSPFPQSNLTRDILVPYCLQCEEISKTIASTHLLFSSGGTSSSCHQDGYENLLTLIAGTKEVLVANSSYTQYFYPNNYTTVPGLSPIDPDAVDLIKYPDLLKVPFHKVVLQPGDILYIPQTWWHHVRSTGCPNIGISLWFHQFPFREEDLSNENEPSVYEDVVQNTRKFEEYVRTFPETIECHKQNKPITEVYKPNPADWDTPGESIPEQKSTTLASGHKMPMFGLGTAGLLSDTKTAMLSALKAGYRMFDTAQAYDNEEAVGEAVKEGGVPRDEVFIVSKIHPRFLGYHETLKSVEESLRRLKMDYIDLMLIHSMDCDEGPGARLTCEKGEPKGSWEDSWKALETLVRSGKVRSIGVSNYEVHDLKRLLEIATVPPSIVQNWFDPFNQDRNVRELCKLSNIRYMGYSTLGSAWAEEGYGSNPVMNDEGLRKIASKFDASIPQLVLKWAVENDVIVIPRSRNPNHIETNFNFHHVALIDSDHKYFSDLDGQLSGSEDSETQETGTEGESGREKTGTDDRTQEKQEDASDEPKEGAQRTKPKLTPEIDDKVVLNQKVDVKEATVFVGVDDHWLYAFDANTGQVRWKYGTADETGSMCAFNHDETVVYCGTDDKSIRALNPIDGSLIWKFKTEGAVTSSIRVGEDGTLYVGCLDKHMYAVNPDGSLKWKKPFADEVWTSPALQDGGRVVFMGTMAEHADSFFALDGSTGDVMWKLNLGPLFSSPSLSSDNKMVVVCSFDGNCYALDTLSGKTLWVFEGDSGFQSSPVVSKTTGSVFVGSSEGNIYCIDSSTGKQKWVRIGKGELFSSPFPTPDGNVYIGSGDGEVLALRQADGTEVWSYKTEGNLFSSPRLTKNGLLIIGGLDTYMYALKAADGSLVWKYKTDGPVVGTALINADHAEPKA